MDRKIKVRSSALNRIVLDFADLSERLDRSVGKLGTTYFSGKDLRDSKEYEDVQSALNRYQEHLKSSVREQL